MTASDGRGRRWNFASFVDSLNPSMTVGLLMPDGTLMHANRTALDAIGARLEDVIGVAIERTPWWRHSESSRRRLLTALEAARRGESSRFDVPFKASDGELRTVDFSLRPVVGDDGEVAFLLASACDVTERKRAERQASYLANHDAITGLPNRRWLQRHLADVLRGPRHPGLVPAVLCIDVDRLARVNAALGSAAGDAVLKTIGARFAQCLPAPWPVVRFDSDEYVVVCDHSARDGAGAEALARALLHSLEQPVRAGDDEIFVTASIGIALAEGPIEADSLLRQAAVAVDRAKAKGRNRYAVHRGAPVDADARRFVLECALRQAIERDEFDLVYQPQIAVASGEITGVEALLRWQHPQHGAVSPAQFIPIAEEAGLISRIGDWVLAKACATAAAWQRAGLPSLRVTVNVSAHQLREGDLAQRVLDALAAAGLEPRRFGVEVTETVLMEHVGEAAAQLGRLRDAGVEISLDDFGTGYSSLGYLRRLPLDAVKIDRSLVPAMAGESDALPIARAIIAMAHSLGLRVVAEGVETEGQLELLVANHCDEFQGYHFSAPVPAASIETMLRAGRRLPLSERRRAARARTALVVSSDPRVIDRMRQSLPLRFGDRIRVESCGDPYAALRRLGETPVDIVVADFCMAGCDGISLLNRAAEVQPRAVRMMLLGPADLGAVIDDTRQVDVFRYLSKPWTPNQLHAHFEAALERIDQARGEHILSAGLQPLTLREPDAIAAELLRLEQMEPGLTAVARGPLDEVLLPSQLMTMPGDLWKQEDEPATARRE